MKTTTLIKNILTVNEGNEKIQNLLLKEGFIFEISEKEIKPPINCKIIDGTGKILLPGIIDDQVHFREPGLTHKGEIFTESRAAAAGGITSYMEMPNTMPQTITQDSLEAKYQLAAQKSILNYSFFMGTTNDNIEEVLKTPLNTVCGIKIFMGASTGNMLVDNDQTLATIFSQTKHLVAVHCEDEAEIRKNSIRYKEKYGENIPIKFHPYIRSADACYKSSAKAVALAKKYNTRLHVLHISTAKELDLFENKCPSHKKRITAEVCVHHLWFSEEDYEKKGTFIKWNPAVKTKKDKSSLFEALLSNKLDVIATDHAPHTLGEKNNSYFKAPSGGPMVQHSLLAMLAFYEQGKITLAQIVEKMCHTPAKIFQVSKRGFLKKGYYADLVIIDPKQTQKVTKKSLFYKCGWSPLEGETFNFKVTQTFVNGNLIYNNGVFNDEIKGMRLAFDREN